MEKISLVLLLRVHENQASNQVQHVTKGRNVTAPGTNNGHGQLSRYDCVPLISEGVKGVVCVCGWGEIRGYPVVVMTTAY